MKSNFLITLVTRTTVRMAELCRFVANDFNSEMPTTDWGVAVYGEGDSMAKRGENLRKGQPRPWVLTGEKHPFWKGDAAHRNTKRGRARRRYKLDKCELCGKPATDRHHKDDDTGNNEPDNIQLLCRRCHMVADGRLQRLDEGRASVAASLITPPQPCSNCGKLSKPLRRGLCHACNEYERRNGEPRPYIDTTFRDSVAAKNEKPCKRCLRPANVRGYPTKGYCVSCYAYVLRQDSLGLPIGPFVYSQAKYHASNEVRGK